MAEEKIDQNEEKARKFEMLCGLVLAIFAAILAISGLGGDNCDKGRMSNLVESNNAYSWYQSKSIKLNLAKGQRDTIKSLLDAGVIAKTQASAVEESIKKGESNIAKYEKEQKEILEGSKAVGKDNWVQEDKNGKLGNIIGANEYKEISEKFAKAADTFDIANLFLQLCLVMGAISIVLKESKIKTIFFFVMLCLGSIGTIFGVLGYISSWGL